MPAASASIWAWKMRGEERRARIRALRTGAVLRALAGAAIGGLLYFLWDRIGFATAVWSISAASLLLALLSPLGAYAALERALAALGRGVGRALTWLLLAPIFLVGFGVFGLLFRRGRRDPLHRVFDPSAETYWRSPTRARSIDKPY